MRATKLYLNSEKKSIIRYTATYMLAVAICGNAVVAQPGVALMDRMQTTGKAKSASVTVNMMNVPLRDIINEISRQGGIRIIFSDKLVDKYSQQSVRLKGMMAESALKEVLANTELTYVKTSTNQLSIVERKPSAVQGKNFTSGNISGRLIDSATREPIAGVVVSVSGSSLSVKADEKGLYELKGLPPGEHVLMFRVLGFSTIKRTVLVEDGKTVTLNVALSASANSLTEVVTTATGKQRRVDISNDVVKIDAARLMEAAPVRSVTDLLQAAQINGVTITPSSGEPGAPKRIRIGGVGSISQNNDPVVIVDGVWVKSAFSTQDIARQLGGQVNSYGSYLPSRLDAIDPSTIETIEVVRGPAAATLYGPDAANGVILITTKRGGVGPARWDFQYSHDRKSPTGTFTRNYEGFGRSEFSTQTRSCSAFDIRARACIQDSIISWSDGDPLLLRERHGSAHQLAATVSGGTKQVRYSLSAGYNDQRGTRKQTGVNVARARLLDIPFDNRHLNPSQLRDRRISTRLDISPRDGLDFSLSLEGSQQNSREDNMSNIFSGLTLLDTASVLKAQSGSAAIENKGSGTTRGMVSLVTRWSPYSWVLLNTTLGVDKEVQKENRTISEFNCRIGTCLAGTKAEEGAGRDASVYTIRANSSFMPSLGSIGRYISVQPGISFDLRRQANYSHTARVQRFTDSVLTTGTFTDGPTSALGGVSLNANIRLFDRISFDPAIRHDFSGAKELENNSKSYPRFGTSWLVSEEPFFPRTTWLSTLRLRGAFGYASVQPKLSQLYGQYSRSNVNLTGVSQPAFVIGGIGNPELQPERSAEVEMGFDADMFDERLLLTLTYAHKQNTNTLINRQLAPSAGAGAGTRQENIAKVVNQATMIQTILRPIERDNFRVRLTSNITFAFNEIKSLGAGVSPFGNFEQRYAAGYPVGALWNRPILGIHDKNDDGYLDADEFVFADSFVYMGSNMPKYTMGQNIEIGFLNNFTFNAFIDYKGPFTQNRSVSWNNLRGYWDVNVSREEQLLPQIVTKLSSSGYRDLQTVKELRLQSASISMNVPASYVRRLGAQSIHISLQGSNLGLWTSYRGRDPGINSSPIGERISDSGNTIGLPRNYSLQFRVRY